MYRVETAYGAANLPPESHMIRIDCLASEEYVMTKHVTTYVDIRALNHVEGTITSITSSHPRAEMLRMKMGMVKVLLQCLGASLSGENQTSSGSIPTNGCSCFH